MSKPDTPIDDERDKILNIIFNSPEVKAAFQALYAPKTGEHVETTIDDMRVVLTRWADRWNRHSDGTLHTTDVENLLTTIDAYVTERCREARIEVLQGVIDKAQKLESEGKIAIPLLIVANELNVLRRDGGDAQ